MLVWCLVVGVTSVLCPMRPVLHSSFSHPKADVTGTMGSGRLPWRPTGGRLKVSPPRGAQQMEAEVIICSSVHLRTPHTSMPPLARSLSLSYCVTVLQRRIRSDTAWLALAVNTALRHANTHTTQLKQFVLLSINTHYHALLCGCDKCFLVYRGPASQPLMPAMETIHRGTAVGPKCSLPPIVQPLHFFINSKSKKKKKKKKEQ